MALPHSSQSTPSEVHATAFDALLAKAERYSHEQLAETTRRGYDSDFTGFSAWCNGMGRSALPASPATIAGYAADIADHLSPATVSRHLAAIAKFHELAGHPSPLTDAWLKGVLRGLRRSRPCRSVGKDPLLLRQLEAVLAVIPDGPAGDRDRALLLTAWMAALRRAELVALDVPDLQYRDRGVVFLIRTSKGDQQGEGAEVAVPSAGDERLDAPSALRRWLDAGGITAGPVFRPVSRSGRVLDSRLTGRSVALILQRHATRAGIDATRLGAHSLRSGMATESVRRAPEHLVAAHLRHKNVATTRRYLRDAEVFDQNPITLLGL